MTLTIQDLNDVELSARMLEEQWWQETRKMFMAPQLERLALVAFASAPQEVRDQLPEDVLLQIANLQGGY